MGWVLVRDCSSFSNKGKAFVALSLLVYLCALVAYVNYINSLPSSFGYGIPQADMLAHYKGAQAISQGYSWNALSIVADRFEQVGIGSIGYFLYATFLSLCIFTLGVFDPATNVYLVYVFQTLLSLDACVKFGKFFSSCDQSIKPIYGVAMLVCCVPFAVQAFQLMRDIYYMWFIAAMFSIATSDRTRVLFGETSNDNISTSTFRVKHVAKLLGLIVCIILCLLLRYYSLMVFLPILLYESRFKKFALPSILIICLVLLFGSGIIGAIRQAAGISWAFTSPELSECFSFLLFPNIFNQLYYLLHWASSFAGYVDVSGTNAPGVYFAMALWNVVVIPLGCLGIYRAWEKDKIECLIWLLILVSVVMTYSITYDEIDTRHKLFMSLPLCFFALKGFVQVKGFSSEIIIILVSALAIVMCVAIIALA
jgi:hypothetical protein